jgi:hypothetical protein
MRAAEAGGLPQTILGPISQESRFVTRGNLPGGARVGAPLIYSPILTTGGIHRAAHAIPDRPFLACLHRPTRICPIRADEIMMNRPAYLRRPIPLGTMR